jgi:hypothetical protein
MRATYILLGVFAASLLGQPALASDLLRDLPEPVYSFAMQFADECRDNGLGDVVASEEFTLKDDLDLNGDQKPDYIVYKCMFGCSKKPSAFTGRLTPCPWGALLLSSAEDYSNIFLPGVVGDIRVADTVKAVISNPRTLRLVGNFCKDPKADFDPQYVYELKSDRFQRVAMCPKSGCSELLK